MVVGVNRFVAEEGLGEVGSRVAKGAVEGLRLSGGVTDGESTGLYAEGEEVPEVVVDLDVRANDGREEGGTDGVLNGG